jgi:hypothetical protein
MISPYSSNLFLIDEIEALAEQNTTIEPIILENIATLKQDLENVHQIIRKLIDFEKGKVDNKEMLSAFNQYKANKSMIMLGKVI